MSSSKAQRERAARYSTPERIEEWSKLYHDGLVDGDVVMLTEDWQDLKKGDIAIIEIRWDSRVNEPVRAIYFENQGICGPPTEDYYKHLSESSRRWGVKDLWRGAHGMKLEKLN